MPAAGESSKEKKPVKRGRSGIKLRVIRACQFVKLKFKDLARAWIIGVVSAFNMLFAIEGIVLLFFFPTTTDQAIRAVNLCWMHITLMVPLLFCGLCGLVAVITRSPKATRWCMVSAPVALILGLPCSITFFTLKCSCENFLQCSALRSFATVGGVTLINPHPTTPGYRKFEGLRRIPFIHPPDYDNIQKSKGYEDADSLLDILEFSAGMNASLGASTETVTELMPPRKRTHMLKGSSMLMAQSSSKNLRPDPPGAPAPPIPAAPPNPAASPGSPAPPALPGSQSKFQHRSIKMRSTSDALLGVLQNMSSAELSSSGSIKVTTVTSPVITQHPTFTSSEKLNVSADTFAVSPKPFSMLGVNTSRACANVKPPEPDIHKLYEINYLIVHSKEEHKTDECHKYTIEFKDDFLDAAWKCRDGDACPEKMQEELENCARHARCGGLKFTIDKKGPAESHEWEVSSCMLLKDVYTESPPEGEGMQGNHSNPVIYFQRNDIEIGSADSTDAKSQEKEDFAKAAREIHEQEKWPHDKWVGYMEQQQHSKCVCDPTSRNCKAFETDEGSVNYWCNVAPEWIPVCEQDAHIDDLKPMPSKSDPRHWSKKLCTGQHWANAQCKCAVGMGVRVTGSEIHSLNSRLKSSITKEKKDAVIGWKCDKWYQSDKQPWCIVGFDSACADREVVEISTRKNLRVFKSAIPCQEETMSDSIHIAEEMCKGVKLAWLAFDTIHYFLILPYTLLLYIFLVNRCSDGSPKEMDGFEAVNDLDDFLATDDDDFFDDEDEDEDESESSTPEEEPKRKGSDKKSKGKKSTGRSKKTSSKRSSEIESGSFGASSESQEDAKSKSSRSKSSDTKKRNSTGGSSDSLSESEEDPKRKSKRSTNKGNSSSEGSSDLSSESEGPKSKGKDSAKKAKGSKSQ